MSGGSYDYLCFAGERTVLVSENECYEHMRKRLEGLGCKRAVHMMNCLKALEGAVEHLTEQLGEVWRIVEWHDSGDRGKEQMDDVLSAFEAGGNDDHLSYDVARRFEGLSIDFSRVALLSRRTT